MDFQIPFIFVSVFTIACVLLILIYKFGIKEKSYEEALAEQRQQTNMLLGTKPKLKEKKNKKATKKGNKTTSESETLDGENEESVAVEKAVEGPKKPHVEFKENVEETVKNKKPNKKERVRSILLNKDEDQSKSGDDQPATTSNHFEESHPKDELELVRISKTEEAKEEKKSKSPKVEDVKSVKPEAAQAVVKEEASALPTNGVVSNTGKEKKKKKSEFNTLQQLAGETNGLSFLLNMVRKAELTRSEVQILIDLLLNKQHEAPTALADWSEGKSDPVQRLKRQLAEKEKLLEEEQQTTVAAQQKLKELRAEYLGERIVLQQKIRGLEEVNQSKQLEATRSHQQAQQLQTQLNEEALKNHSLREDVNALQIQRQQFEIRVAQAQESDSIIGQLQNEVQEVSTLNAQLRMELARLSEENCTEKEHQKGFLVQLNNFQQELDQKNERNRQLEEKRIELEHNLENVAQQDIELKAEVTKLTGSLQQLNDEIRKLEHLRNQNQDDLQKQKEDSNKLINQLRIELKAKDEENTQLKAIEVNGSVKESQKHEIEVLNLHNELSSLKSELNQLEQTREKEVKTVKSLNEQLQSEVDILKVKVAEETQKLSEQIVKNNELRTKNWKVMEALNATESKLKTNSQSRSEDDIKSDFVQRLFPEIKDLKNPELDVAEYLSKLRTDSETSPEIHQLRSKLKHYENVIENTEKMLKGLQNHVQAEEIKWRNKEGHIEEEKLTRSELELKETVADKKKLLVELQSIKSKTLKDLNQSQNGVH